MKIKSIIRNMLVIGLCLTMTTGCMKANLEMEIRADKSMSVSLISAFSDEILKLAEENDADSSNFNMIDEKEKEKYLERGYVVEEIKENGYTGVKIQKNIKNIDEISNRETSNNSIKNIFEDNPQKQYYFVVNYGFFKNHYKAVFKTDEMTEDVPDTSEYDESSYDDLGLNAEELKELTNSMESKFVLTLPNKPISNNADIVSEDGKTLTWNFIQDNPKSTIEFEFELINRGSTYSTIIGISLLILLFLIILFTSSKPKKKKDPVKIDKSSLESNDLGEVDLTGDSMNNKIRENLSL